jgi:hypothetical protein
MQRLRKPQVFDLMSLTAGTITRRSRQVFDLTPLIKWFWAIYMTARDKRGVSAVRLQREPEVSYPTAWRGNFVSEYREKYGKGWRTGTPCTNSPGRLNLTKVTSEGLRKAGNAGAGRIKHPSRSRYHRISGGPKWNMKDIKSGTLIWFAERNIEEGSVINPDADAYMRTVRI